MFGRAATVVGRGSTVRGSLDCGDDDAKIAGNLEGTVTSSATVAITETGNVHGDVSAHEVVVNGVVEGTVTAHDRLRLGSTGRILGDAIYGSLEVDRGGVVKGRTMTITSRPPSNHPAVDETLRLGAAKAERVTADWGLAHPDAAEPESEPILEEDAAPDEPPEDET